MKKLYLFTKDEYKDLDVEEGDSIVFDMPSFCSGDYSAEVMKDEHGLYIKKSDNYLKGCRDFFVYKNKEHESTN